MHEEVETANCPHCRESIKGTELKFMTTEDGDESILVCPDCDTILGSALGGSAVLELVAMNQAADLDEAEEFADALRQMAEGEDVDEELIERFEDRMGPTEVNIN